MVGRGRRTIGTVRIDTTKDGRRYDTKYGTLSTKHAVARLLRDVHRLAERRYKGDYDACVILADLDRALVLARLTPRQAEALHLVYWRDMRQVDAAEAMGVTRQRVGTMVVSALQKIAEVYADWARKEETNGR